MLDTNSKINANMDSRFHGNDNYLEYSIGRVNMISDQAHLSSPGLIRFILQE